MAGSRPTRPQYELEDCIEREYRAGTPVREIVRKCGLRGVSTLYQYLYRLEAKGRIRLRKGHMRRLSSSEIEVIKKLADEGVSPAEISRRLQVSRSTVYRVLKNRVR